MEIQISVLKWRSTFKFERFPLLHVIGKYGRHTEENLYFFDSIQFQTYEISLIIIQKFLRILTHQGVYYYDKISSIIFIRKPPTIALNWKKNYKLTYCLASFCGTCQV